MPTLSLHQRDCLYRAVAPRPCVCPAAIPGSLAARSRHCCATIANTAEAQTTAAAAPAAAVATAVTAPAAAEVAAPVQTATAADTQQQLADLGDAISNESKESSSASGSGNSRLKRKFRISDDPEADATLKARALAQTLLDNPPDIPVIVTAAGPQGTVNAFKVLARASEMLQTKDSSSCLTFKPSRARKGTNGEYVSTGLIYLYVAKAPAADFQDNPTAGELQRAMRPRKDRTAKEIAEHAYVRAKNVSAGVAARFIVSGFVLRSPLHSLAHALAMARAKLYFKQFDLAFTVVRQLKQLQLPQPQQQQQQQEQQQDSNQQAAHVAETTQAPADGNSAAAAAAADASAAAASSSGNEDRNSSSASGYMVAPEYLITAYRVKQHRLASPASSVDNGGNKSGSDREPRQAAAAAARSAEGAVRSAARSSRPSRNQQSKMFHSKATADEAAPAAAAVEGSAVGQGSRPGYVEVPAEEWAHLKEQLEIVPHLTEQLQLMTRQHEQLLSLLAAQEQQQQQDQLL